MTTITENMIDAWYAENTDADDSEMMNLILDAAAFQLIENEIVNELKDSNNFVGLDNDFGDYYWNGTRMVPNPGMDEYFND